MRLIEINGLIIDIDSVVIVNPDQGSIKILYFYMKGFSERIPVKVKTKEERDYIINKIIERKNNV